MAAAAAAGRQQLLHKPNTFCLVIQPFVSRQGCLQLQQQKHMCTHKQSQTQEQQHLFLVVTR
jgi:hypothetical protein